MEEHFKAWWPGSIKVRKKYAAEEACRWCSKKTVEVNEIAWQHEFVGLDFACSSCKRKWKQYAGFTRPPLSTRYAHASEAEQRKNTMEVLRDLKGRLQLEINRYAQHEYDPTLPSGRTTDFPFRAGWEDGLNEMHRLAEGLFFRASELQALDEYYVDVFWANWHHWQVDLGKMSRDSYGELTYNAGKFEAYRRLALDAFPSL
jgi:hypothetical protein